jgi:hypothetical protein
MEKLLAEAGFAMHANRASIARVFDARIIYSSRANRSSPRARIVLRNSDIRWINKDNLVPGRGLEVERIR